MQPDKNNNSNNPETEQPESVLNIIRKEFFDISGHDKEEDLRKSPFYGLTKSGVLQECRAFNDPNTVTQKPAFCSLLMSKVLYLLVVEGETLTENEVIDVFFGATKLFQSMDPNLRRMTYLFIKEVAEKTSADQVIIVVQQLLKDLNSDNELFRANSLRVLSRILDASMLAQVERYIKQAIVHKNPSVASSALLCGLYLYSVNPDPIRRWISEINQSLSYEDEMVQYHGLLLLHAMKINDRLAMNKLLSSLRQRMPTSPLSLCMLIRYSVTLLREDPENENAREIYDMIVGLLRHYNDMVCFEAARALIALPNMTENDFLPLVTMLRVNLGSSKTATKFAAVRILNQLSVTNAHVVESCNAELEYLVSDPNRSVATLAVSTLLRTVEVSRIENLLSRIGGYMNEIDDEFKQILVKSLFSLTFLYPSKYNAILTFLNTLLRDDCSEALKTAIVDTMIEMIEKIPEALKACLLNLCECIEDCEYPQIIIRVLHVIATYGPTSVDYTHFIRFIYNRYILEGAAVRAAAVQALGIFATHAESVRPSIIELLKGCLKDEDDEVRDRAITALIALESNESREEFDALLTKGLPMSISQLKQSLYAYQLRPEGSLDYQHLPVISEPVNIRKTVEKTESVSVQQQVSTPAASLSELYQIPEFATYGTVIRSSKPVMLTEAETEYGVELIKHIFANHVVLQFLVKNTIEGQVMTNVGMRIQLEEGEEEEWKLTQMIPADVITFNDEKSCYVALEYASGSVPEASFNATLVFVAKDIEEDEMDQIDEIEGYDEEYPVENFLISMPDYISRPIITDYRAAFVELGTENEMIEKVSLEFDSIEMAVKGVIDVLGLHVFEGSDRVASGTTNHMLLLAGNLLGSTLIMARCQILMSEEYGCVLKIAIRSQNHDVVETMMSLLQ